MSYSREETYIRNPYVFGSMNAHSPQQNFHLKNNKSPIMKDNYLFNYKNNTNPNLSKSTNLDNNLSILQNSNLLQNNNSQVSFARNFRQRLFETDQNQQIKKQIKKVNYRKQLQLQMKADKQKKQKQKKQLEQWELARQRKFYKEVQKLQAKNNKKSKEQPSYFLLRSSQAKRNKKNPNKSLDQKTQNIGQDDKNPEYKNHNQNKMPNIIKRGGYHNQSVLDPWTDQNSPTQKRQKQNPQQLSHSKISKSQKQQLQMQIIRQKNYQEQRISTIIKLQQKMMIKLDNFKKQIFQTNKQLNLNKQVQIIRNMLKAKPINLQIISIRDNQLFQNRSDFYVFPSLEQSKIRNMNRNHNHVKTQLSRLHSSQINHRNQGINLNQKLYNNSNNLQQRYNFNINTKDSQIEDPQEQQNQRNSRNQVRKRQIKLFNRQNIQNDKNIQNRYDQQSNIDSNNNYISHLPVVNQQQN